MYNPFGPAADLGEVRVTLITSSIEQLRTRPSLSSLAINCCLEDCCSVPHRGVKLDANSRLNSSAAAVPFSRTSPSFY